MTSNAQANHVVTRSTAGTILSRISSLKKDYIPTGVKKKNDATKSAVRTFAALVRIAGTPKPGDATRFWC